MITIHTKIDDFDITAVYCPLIDGSLRLWMNHPRYTVEGPQEEIDKYLKEQSNGNN